MTQRGTRGQSTGAATERRPGGSAGDTPAAGSALAAVEHDLAEFERREPNVTRGALAAICREMARQLDDDRNSATSKSMCAKALHSALDRLRELLPPGVESDGIDELERRAADKLSG